MALPDVFQWLGLGAKRGVLLVDRGNTTLQIFFEPGGVIDLQEKAEVTAFLGFLERNGYWTNVGGQSADLVGLCRELQQPGRLRLQGASSVSGVQALAEVVDTYFGERILDLFAWSFGDFQFRANMAPRRRLLSAPIALDRLMMDWADRSLSVDKFREVFKDSAEVKIMATPNAAYYRPLDGFEGRILSLCRSEQNLLDLAISAGLSEYETLTRLGRLLECSVIRVSNGRSHSSARGSGPPVGSQTGSDSGLLLGEQRWAEDPESDGPPGAGAAFPAGGSENSEPRETVEAADSPATPSVVLNGPTDEERQKLLADGKQQLQTAFLDEVESAGIGPDTTPSMAIRFDDVALLSLNLSADEGFLLSRVDGRTTIRQLATVCGIPKSRIVGLVVGLFGKKVLSAPVGPRTIDASFISGLVRMVQDRFAPVSSRDTPGRGGCPALEFAPLKLGQQERSGSLDVAVASPTASTGKTDEKEKPEGSLQISELEDPELPPPGPGVAPSKEGGDSSLDEPTGTSGGSLEAMLEQGGIFDESDGLWDVQTLAADSRQEELRAKLLEAAEVSDEEKQQQPESLTDLDLASNFPAEPDLGAEGTQRSQEPDGQKSKIIDATAQSSSLKSPDQNSPSGDADPKERKPTATPDTAKTVQLDPSNDSWSASGTAPRQTETEMIAELESAPDLEAVLGPAEVVFDVDSSDFEDLELAAEPVTAEQDRTEHTDYLTASELAEWAEEAEREVEGNSAATLAAAEAAKQARLAHRVEISRLRCKQGMAALKSGRMAEALEALRESVDLCPENPVYWASLAQAHLIDGSDLPEAERCCRQAMETNHWDPRLYLLLGRIQQKAERPDLAAQSYFRALELDPANAKVHEALQSLRLA